MEKQAKTQSQMGVIDERPVLWSPDVLRQMKINSEVLISSADYSKFMQAKTRIQIETGMMFRFILDLQNKVIKVTRTV